MTAYFHGMTFFGVGGYNDDGIAGPDQPYFIVATFDNLWC